MKINNKSQRLKLRAFFSNLPGNASALVLGLVFSGFLAEFTVRIYVDDGMHYDLEMWKYAREIKRVSSVPGLGHEHKPSSSGVFMGAPVSINSAGLRDREYGEKSQQAVRILMLGDSLTFGWGVQSNDTPAKLIESKLNKATKVPYKFEVINSGVGNYNTAQEVTYFLERGHSFEPDVVVLNYFINDAEPMPRKKGNFLSNYSYAAVVGLGAYDSLYRSYFGGADWKEYYRGLYGEDAPGWADAKTAIGELAKYCHERNIKLMLVNYPELHSLKDYPFNAISSALRDVSENNKIPFLDLLPSVKDMHPGSLWVSDTDAHPNADANDLFSEQIVVALRNNFPDLITR
jgi:lysophospholipase L1-like esterase